MISAGLLRHQLTLLDCNRRPVDGDRVRRAGVRWSVDDEVIDALDEEADERDVTRADMIRDAIDSRSEVDELRREVDRLRAELRATNARQDDVGELVAYVDEERELRRRERERRDAPIWRRGWWYVFGRQ